MIADIYLRADVWQVAVALLLYGGLCYAAGEIRQHWRGPAKTIEELQLARGTIKWQSQERDKIERELAEAKDKLRAAAGGAAVVTQAVAGPSDREAQAIEKR